MSKNKNEKKKRQYNTRTLRDVFEKMEEKRIKIIDIRETQKLFED